jgi:hypothetical protein
MKEAKSSTVALYKYVYKAGRPVTFDEIVENALPPGMRAAAYNAYIEHHKTVTGGAIIDDGYWEKENNREITWRWWVGLVIELSSHNRHLIMGTQDGSPARGKRKESLLYTPGRPPWVRYEDGKLRPWTTELDQEYERIVAGQWVVQRTDEVLATISAITMEKKQRDLLTKYARSSFKALKVVQSRP